MKFANLRIKTAPSYGMKKLTAGTRALVKLRAVEQVSLTDGTTVVLVCIACCFEKNSNHLKAASKLWNAKRNATMYDGVLQRLNCGQWRNRSFSSRGRRLRGNEFEWGGGGASVARDQFGNFWYFCCITYSQILVTMVTVLL